jgi:RNA polymerase sigma-70 factor (ECF subfamily)
MENTEINERLSRISTVWTVLHQAHQGPAEAAASARQQLVQRYGGAVYRYLLAALRDPHAADDLAQEFALSLVRGDFHKADPERGRFRQYVKTVLFHLVSRYRKQQQAQPRPLPAGVPDLADLVPAPAEDPDRQFRESWRDELLARTWEALAEAQPAFYTVLRFRAAHPKMPSSQMAEGLGRELSKPLTAGAVRQTLHRARALFADLLLEAVAYSLEKPTAEEVEEELRELNLLAYCQPALDRQTQG